MHFQDVVFLPPPPPATFSTFRKKCGRGESLRTPKCRKTVVGGKQRHVPCKILLLQQVEVNLTTISFGDIQEFNKIVSGMNA